MLFPVGTIRAACELTTRTGSSGAWSFAQAFSAPTRRAAFLLISNRLCSLFWRECLSFFIRFEQYGKQCSATEMQRTLQAIIIRRCICDHHPSLWPGIKRLRLSSRTLTNRSMLKRSPQTFRDREKCKLLAANFKCKFVAQNEP